MKKYNIKIARDFTKAPGFRFKKQGPKSGEELREHLREPLFEDPDDKHIITIDFNGCYGFATSFLEEAFGGLVRKTKMKNILERFRFVADDNHEVKESVIRYIKEATERLPKDV